MKIGVTADTHCHEIPKQLINDFKKVDCIIHVGDFCTVTEVKRFEKLATLYAVYGNMDGADVRKKFPEKQIVDLGGAKIGLYHGAGAKDGVFEDVQSKFKGENVDAVIFGHTHESVNTTVGKTLYFNPGSPNDLVFAPDRTYGMLEINSGKIKAKIIKVKA